MTRSRSLVAVVAAVVAAAGVGGFIAVDSTSTAAPGDACATPGVAGGGHYWATAGESWTSIAAKLGVTAKGLRDFNGQPSPTSLTATFPVAICLHIGPLTTGVTTSTTTPPSSTVPAGSSTSSSAPATTQPAATTTSAPPSSTTSNPSTTTTTPSSGPFNEAFSGDLSGWFTAHGKPAANDDCVPVGGCPTSIGIVDGKLVIVNGEQDYGDATARSLTKYDLSAGGTVSLDIADDGDGNRLVGSAYVMFSEGPQDAKHQHALSVRSTPYCVPDGSTACIPTEGVTVWLMDNCRVPWAPPIVVRYPSMVDSQGACAAPPDGKLRLVYTPGHLSIRNGADAEIVAYDVTLPEVGYLTLGVHNHASIKYVGAPAVTGTFDNVSYPTSSAPSPTTTTPAPTTAPPTTLPAGAAFVEPFTDPSGLGRFDVQLRTYGPSVVASTFRGEHDSECHGPDTYRTIAGGQASTGFMDVSATGLVYRCGGAVANAHMMTALSTPGIAILAFSPKQTFTDVTSVCWDQNMNNLGGGKWANVLVVPAGDVAARGGNLTYTAAKANGIGDPEFRQPPPANAYDFTWLVGSIYSQGAEVAWKGYTPGGIDPTSAPRHQICLKDRGATIEVHRPDQTVDTYQVGARFPTGPVRVIWQDASYDPDKHGGSVDHLTWHWDNITIES